MSFSGSHDFRLSPNQHVKDRKRAEHALGRQLKSTEQVHHFTPTQLVICENAAYHSLLHEAAYNRRLASDEPFLKRERDAALVARDNRAQAEVLLVALLTKTAWRADAHLSPIAHTHLGSTMNFVVCVHIGSDRLAWRISDFEAYEYFGHLKTAACPSGLSRDAKMARLADLASQK